MSKPTYEHLMKCREVISAQLKHYRERKNKGMTDILMIDIRRIDQDIAEFYPEKAISL